MDPSGIQRPETIEDQERRIRRLRIALAVATVVVLLLSVVGGWHLAMAHLTARMSGDALKRAAGVSHRLAKRIKEFRVGMLPGQKTDERALAEIAAEFRAAVRSDARFRYAMLVSKDGRIVLHTNEGSVGKVLADRIVSSEDQHGSVRELPSGRFGNAEFLYEAWTPVAFSDRIVGAVIVAVSKTQAERRVLRVEREMAIKFATIVLVGSVVVALPVIGLVLLWRRHQRIKAQAFWLQHLASVGDLARGLAHEIRNPLNAIRFNVKILEEEAKRLSADDGAGYQAIAQRTVHEIRRLEDLLASYMLYARPGTGERSECDLNAVAERVLAFVEPEAMRHGIAVARRFAPHAPRVTADAKRLMQAILNLALNARQALKLGGGTITATTSMQNGFAVFTLADDGPGIPEDIRGRVFEPFFTAREDGCGLGLAIVKRVAEDHGGSVELQCNKGGGCTFIMRLPSAQSGR